MPQSYTFVQTWAEGVEDDRRSLIYRVTVAFMGDVLPPTKSPLDTSLADPLSELTRKERRHLLSISLAAILIAKAGLVPTEISALGIKLTPANKSAFLILITAVTMYYLIAFLVYAGRDLIVWGHAATGAAFDSAIEYLSEDSKQERHQIETRIEEDEEYRKTYVAETEELHRMVRLLRGWIPFRRTQIYSQIIVWAVLVFEFIVPVAVACYAIVAIFRAARAASG